MAAAVAVAVAACLASSPALAGPPAGADPAALDRTVGFLQQVQNPDGGFGGVRGAPSDPGISAWAALALAAAGINPFDQAKPGGTDAATYVLETTRFEVTTDYERAALVAIAAGIPLRDFNGVDLVAGILAAQLPDGSFAHADDLPPGERAVGGVNDTAFAIFALGGVQEPAVQAALQRAATWLLGVQNADGGWEYTTGEPTSSADITGAILQALRHAGRAGTQAELRALDYLRALQQDDGGFPYSTKHPGSNTASTAWTVQGLWAVGADPRGWRKGGHDPLDYLRSMQQPDGEILWKAGPDGGTNSIWMTAYCAPAFAGMTWPPTEVSRRTPPDPDTGEPGEGAPPPGDGHGPDGAGGSTPDGNGQVIAGGGGNGAPLFSRPQPQSRGSTPGGVRRTHRGRRPEPRRRERDHTPTTMPRQESTSPPAARPAEPGTTETPAAPVPPGPDAAGIMARGAADRAGGADGTAGQDAAGADAAGGGAADPGDPAAGAGGTAVRGRVIEDPRSLDQPGVILAATPGLRGARAGGRTGRAVALGIGGSLLVMAALGSALERRRPGMPSPTAPPALAATGAAP